MTTKVVRYTLGGKELLQSFDLQKKDLTNKMKTEVFLRALREFFDLTDIMQSGENLANLSLPL